MKTYIAITAVLCSLVSAVDLFDDDLLDNDDFLDDYELSDDETSARTMSDSLFYNGYKYTYRDKKKKWSQANKDCKNRGGHLLSIRSDDELEEILPLIPLNSKGRHRSVHIGLKKEKGKFEWVDSDDKYSEDEVEDLTWEDG